MDRQSVLERMGWIFARIRSSEFLRNPARAMKPVFEKLEILGIPAQGSSADADAVALASHEVIDLVITRAEELRRNWAKSSGAPARPSVRTSATATH